MDRFCFIALIGSVFSFLICIEGRAGKTLIMTTDDMENFINPDDLQMILDYYNKNSSVIDHDAMQDLTTTTQRPPVGCFGTAGYIWKAIDKIFSFNLKPSASDDINTHFYFSSRKMKYKVQVDPGKQFGLESVDFDPKRKTVVIIHGFMSYSGADWVKNMTRAYLESEDVNVIAVDWSGGSNTFKYWRAVANTRTVGRDIANFLWQVKNETGLNLKNCHFIGHSLGAQIASFASSQIGKVSRITGLDPALPCFNTTSTKDRLDPSDADFVDIIHTNGKLSTIGFGFPYPTGHVDFYPNGGIRQPGCSRNIIPFYNTIDQAICSHGRAYILFTESLTNKNCSFSGTPWDLTILGLRKSIETKCYSDKTLCPEMGIKASKRKLGSFLVITQDKEPYCVSEWERHHPSPDLIEDITNYLQTLSITDTTASNGAASLPSIIPFRISKSLPLPDITTMAPRTTTSSGWFKWFYDRLG